MHAERRPGSSAAISEQLLVFPIARDYDSVYRFCRFDVDVCRYSAPGELRFDVDVCRYSASCE